MLKNMLEKAIDFFNGNKDDLRTRQDELLSNGLQSSADQAAATATATTIGIDLFPVGKLLWKEIRYESKETFMPLDGEEEANEVAVRGGSVIGN